MRLGQYEIHQSEQGFCSIRHIASGETMHPARNPNEEAEDLYVTQPRLRERFCGEGELVIWDVGLGAATNATAILRCYQKLVAEGRKDLVTERLVSFEKDLDSLRLAYSSAEGFPHLQNEAVASILQKNHWGVEVSPEGPRFEWQLHPGDFFEEAEGVEIPRPHIVIYDPFSADRMEVVRGPATLRYGGGAIGGSRERDRADRRDRRRRGRAHARQLSAADWQERMSRSRCAGCTPGRASDCKASRTSVAKVSSAPTDLASRSGTTARSSSLRARAARWRNLFDMSWARCGSDCPETSKRLASGKSSTRHAHLRVALRILAARL